MKTITLHLCLLFICLSANVFAQAPAIKIAVGDPNYGIRFIEIIQDNKPIRINGNGQLAGIPANVTVARRDDGKTRSVTFNSKTMQFDYSPDGKINTFTVNNQKYMIQYNPNNTPKSIANGTNNTTFVYYPNATLKTIQNNIPILNVEWTAF
jgi:hypothetical protein